MAVIIALLAVTLVLVGGENQGVSSAATVNGQPISEQKVTNYIGSMREQSGMTDDSTWASYLKTYSMTASDLRTQVIDQYAKQMVAEQEAKKQGISVSDSDITDQISTMREQYGLTDDDEWTEALSQVGYTESTYRSLMKDELLQEKLCQKAVATPSISQTDLITFISTYGSYFSTDSWTAPASGATVDLNSIPSDVLSKIESAATQMAWQSQAQTYLNNLYTSANIKIKEMPSGLPYDVDTTNAESMTSSYGYSTSASDSSSSTSAQ